jgi:hypothetical protein
MWAPLVGEAGRSGGTRGARALAVGGKAEAAGLRFRALCPVLGSALVLAALAKAYQFLQDPFSGAVASADRRLGVALVEAEWCLGLWLFTGLFPRVTRRISITFFAALGCAALYKSVSGESSCGCLGPIAVRPLYAFAFDATAVATLLRAGRAGTQGPIRGPGFLKLGLFATVAAWVGVPWAILAGKAASESHVVGTGPLRAPALYGGTSISATRGRPGRSAALRASPSYRRTRARQAGQSER